MKLAFGTPIGVFVADGKLIEHVPCEGTDKDIKQALKKYPDARAAQTDEYKQLLPSLKDSKYFQLFHAAHVRDTIQQLRRVESADLLVNYTINSLQDLEAQINQMVKRCREWYGLYCPEASRMIADNIQFVDVLVKKTKLQILEELGVREPDSMGVELDKPDIMEVQLLAEEIRHLHQLRGVYETYLTSLLKRHCSNVQEICGTIIAAKLLAKSGGLKRLAMLPSSTIQLLGAEKALFRHLTRKARSPKHGLIVNHPLVQRVGHGDKGKAARALADKISMCARLDYFKGAFKAKEMLQELELRFQ
ncbi:MAG TPA: NOP5/NOP56 family protein [Candidatus Nanoarchaeia archaeon]|nr:NOP5/NOP56 family protein [Candidatus Nanoarchaeia archaeon]